MRIFVLGATGGTGRAIVDHALARGHRVTAFARSPDKLGEREHLVLVRGDPRRSAELASALPGHDIVLSALGRRTKSDRSVLADCARATIDAMKIARVPRLIVVSSALLFPKIGLLGAVMRRYVFADVLRDTREMEDIVRTSEIDWTIARPPRLTNSSPTGRYQVKRDDLPAGGRSVSRSDLGRYLVDEAERHEHSRIIVGVSR
jgi:putative NADH-flavin reductase